MDAVTRKKAAKIKRKGKPTVFHFCDLMCKGLEIKDDQKGEVPLPICLQGEKDETALEYWNSWRCFISALKKELPELLTKEEIRATRGKMLFSLLCEDDSGTYVFLVHQELVAKKLGIPSRISFSASNLTDAFNKLRFLRFAGGKKNPEIQSLQKISAIIKDLPLIIKCQLNLLASAKKPWPKSAIDLAKNAKPTAQRQ